MFRTKHLIGVNLKVCISLECTEENIKLKYSEICVLWNLHLDSLFIRPELEVSHFPNLLSTGPAPWWS